MIDKNLKTFDARLWRPAASTRDCGAVLWCLSLLHNFIQLSLNSGSTKVQTLLTACQRFAMVKISDNGHGYN